MSWEVCLYMYSDTAMDLCPVSACTIFAAVGSLWDSLKKQVVILVTSANWRTKESIVCPGKTSKPSRKSLCNTSREMLWEVIERTPAECYAPLEQNTKLWQHWYSLLCVLFSYMPFSCSLVDPVALRMWFCSPASQAMFTNMSFCCCCGGDMISRSVLHPCCLKGSSTSLCKLGCEGSQTCCSCCCLESVAKENFWEHLHRSVLPCLVWSHVQVECSRTKNSLVLWLLWVPLLS